MKQSFYTVSILNNTNKLVASSNSDLSSLREGTLIKFGNDLFFNKILNVESFYYIKKFEVINPKVIQIQGDTGINLLKGDTIDISFKEYELQTVFSIENPGKNYQVGDIVNLEGGIPTINLMNGFKTVTELEIKSVEKRGKIDTFSIKEKGKYYEPPPKNAKVINGAGEKAVLNVEYDLIDAREKQERNIVNIVKEATTTSIHLDYPLPIGLKEGTLSVNKWCAYLTTLYQGNTKIESNCQVSRDFTPHCGFLLMNKGSITPEIIYNETISILDQKIKNLEEEIAKLKN